MGRSGSGRQSREGLSRQADRKPITHQEGLDGEENCADLERGRPLVLENVKADAPQLVDVRVVHTRQEPYLTCRVMSWLVMGMVNGWVELSL